jgi:hypothetical protein
MAGFLLLALVCLPARGARAQAARLDSLLGHPTAMAIQRLLDSAAAMHLPVEGLRSLAFEGAMRRVPPARVQQAVARAFDHLRIAREALGPEAPDAELSAGAGALLAGASPAQLRDLRRAAARRPLTVPLVVLGDFLTRGVPVDTAVQALYVGVLKGASDAELNAYRQSVERDIADGVAPGLSTLSRLSTVPGLSAAEIGRLWKSRDHQELLP